MLLKPPALPREHGAWVMLTIPMVLGLAVGAWRSLPAWLISPAAALVFLAHHALVPWLQRVREGKFLPAGYAARRLLWGSIYLATATALFGAAVALAGAAARPAVLALAGSSAALAAVYVAASIFGEGRFLVAEMLGMAGMALTAPMLTAAAGYDVSPELFGGAAMALGYYFSSLAYVRAYGRDAALGKCVAAHAAIAVGLVACAGVGVLSQWWWIAFAPVLARTALGLWRPPADLRALGMREIPVALAFTALACAL